MLQSKAPHNSYLPIQKTSTIENFCYSNGQLSVGLIALFSLPLSLWIILLIQLLIATAFYIFYCRNLPTVRLWRGTVRTSLALLLRSYCHYSASYTQLAVNFIADHCKLLLSINDLRIRQDRRRTWRNKIGPFFCPFNYFISPSDGRLSKQYHARPRHVGVYATRITRTIKIRQKTAFKKLAQMDRFYWHCFFIQGRNADYCHCSPLPLAFLNKDQFSSGPKRCCVLVHCLSC